MIDSVIIEKIKSAIDIVDVVNEFVELTKKGQNYVGLCPFHDDTTPSLSVSPARGTYKCFACGKGGDAIDFLCNLKGLSFYEAMKWLADRYHIEIPEKQPQNLSSSKRDLDGMYDTNRAAMQYYESCLTKADGGKGLKYFRDRGISDEMIQTFHLGYCPAQSEVIGAVLEQVKTMKYLFRNGEDVTFKSGKTLHVDNGVGIVYKEKARFLDVYSERVMFPWLDARGRVVGFAGRCLAAATKGVERKYVNSPESLIYHKSEELYGLFQAIPAIREKDCVYVVEGYLDVIALYGVGIKNVVANSGTWLSSAQAQLLLKYTKNIVMTYDADTAGMNAMLGNMDVLLKEGANVRCLLLPEGEDPDSFVHRHSSETVTEYFDSNQMDFLDFQCRMLLPQDGDPVKTNESIRTILKTIELIQDSILKELYLKKLCKVTSLNEEVLRGKLEVNHSAIMAVEQSLFEDMVDPSDESSMDGVLFEEIVKHLIDCHQMKGEELLNLFVENLDNVQEFVMEVAEDDYYRRYDDSIGSMPESKENHSSLLATKTKDYLLNYLQKYATEDDIICSLDQDTLRDWLEDNIL